MRQVRHFTTLAIVLTALFSSSSFVLADDNFMEKIERLERDVNALQRIVYKNPNASILRTQNQNYGIGETEASETTPENIIDTETSFKNLSAIERQLAEITNTQELLLRDIEYLKQQHETFKADILLQIKTLQEAELSRQQAEQKKEEEEKLRREAALKELKEQKLREQKIPSIDKKPDFKQDKAGVADAKDSEKEDTKNKNTAPVSTNVTIPATEQNKQTAKQAYDEAYSYIKQNKYVKAEDTFKAFIKNYPNDTLVPNAMYWLGETYYVRGQYTDAAVIFAECYEKYPTAHKAPDNFLKLGLSVAALGKKEEACIVFLNYETQYPSALPVFKNRVKKEIERNQCNK